MEKRIIKNESGMTLVEILIVITLIAIAGSFVVGKLLERLNEGKVQSAGIQINNFKTQIEDYRRYCNQYPTTDQGLEALTAKPTAAPDCPNYPASAFLDKLPKDPWGVSYFYESDGKTYVITSYGADTKEGGEGFDKDIKSNEL